MAPLLRAWPTKPKRTSPGLPKKRRLILGAALLCGLFGLVCLPDEMLSLEQYISRNLRNQLPDNVTTYDQKSIMDTAKHFPKFVPRLLVFDGNGTFEAFGIQHTETEYFDQMKYNWRYSNLVPLLVRALKQHFPDRFRPGQPVFQMLFSEADSTNSPCVNDRDGCPVESFAPFALFGTSPKDDSMFPTLKTFPFSTYSECLYELKVHGRETCKWPQEVNTDLEWDSLVNTIAWRGSDYPFMNFHKEYTFMGPWNMKHRFKMEWKNATRDEMLTDMITPPYSDDFGPRWRAALQSVIASDQAAADGTQPWIDSRFVGGTGQDVRDTLVAKGIAVNGERMSAFDMSKYKYQIDFGGGGGTTWEGTITKLMMPGVLFHHETVNMDWFYDLMIPWVHYIPVKTDLSDLREQFELAEKDPELMKKISAQATKLAEYLMSKEYMDKVFQDLFVDYVGKLVSTYKPTGTWEEMQESYQTNKYELFSIATCNDDIKCAMRVRKNKVKDIKIVSIEHVPGDEGIFGSKPTPESPAVAVAR